LNSAEKALFLIYSFVWPEDISRELGQKFEETADYSAADPENADVRFSRHKTDRYKFN
jgi:hypothetical protein